MKRIALYNKKGFTLIELIAVLAIMTVILAAACLALYTGAKSTADGAADYAAHGDAYLLETWLRNNLPDAAGVDVGTKKTTADFSGSAEVLNLHFDSNRDFTAEKNGSPVMQASGIEKIVLSTAAVGANQELHYEITAKSGGRSFLLSGGIVLNNITAALSVGSTISDSDSATYVNIAK